MAIRDTDQPSVLIEGDSTDDTVQGSAFDPAKYPAVEAAYAFVIPSYAWIQGRLDAVDRRIEGLITFIATITLAVPIFVVSAAGDGQALEFASLSFIAAIAVFLGTMTLGMYARMTGGMSVASPRVLYEKTLWKGDMEFKKDAIYWAGEHFEKNRSLINLKGLLANMMTVLFLAEGLLWALWIIPA